MIFTTQLQLIMHIWFLADELCIVRYAITSKRQWLHIKFGCSQVWQETQLVTAIHCLMVNPRLFHILKLQRVVSCGSPRVFPSKARLGSQLIIDSLDHPSVLDSASPPAPSSKPKPINACLGVTSHGVAGDAGESRVVIGLINGRFRLWSWINHWPNLNGYMLVIFVICGCCMVVNNSVQ